MKSYVLKLNKKDSKEAVFITASFYLLTLL